ncbi:NADH-ubiquinone oxidoreductase chain 4L, partial [Mucuna pruriens]
MVAAADSVIVSCGFSAFLETRKILLMGLHFVRDRIFQGLGPFSKVERFLVNSNLLIFFVSLDDVMGQAFASLVSIVAAVDSAIGVKVFLRSEKIEHISENLLVLRMVRVG